MVDLTEIGYQPKDLSNVLHPDATDKHKCKYVLRLRECSTQLHCQWEGKLQHKNILEEYQDDIQS